MFYAEPDSLGMAVEEKINTLSLYGSPPVDGEIFNAAITKPFTMGDYFWISGGDMNAAADIPGHVFTVRSLVGPGAVAAAAGTIGGDGKTRQLLRAPEKRPPDGTAPHGKENQESDNKGEKE